MHAAIANGAGAAGPGELTWKMHINYNNKDLPPYSCNDKFMYPENSRICKIKYKFSIRDVIKYL